MKKITRLVLFLIINLFVMANTTQAQLTGADIPVAKSSGYVPVKDAKVYYEVYGDKGEPVVLLHGAFMTIGMNWWPLINYLSQTKKVIAIELDGHGHTPLSNRPLSLSMLASDVSAVMKHLKTDSAVIIGYSFGGSVAYQFAVQYPAMLKKLVIISSVYKSDGWQKEGQDALKSLTPESLDGSPLQTEYVKVAPDSTAWHKFIAKMLKLNAQPFDIGEQNIKKIKSPVLIISGDNDGVDKTILINTYKALGGGVLGDMVGIPSAQLAIIPGKTHVTVMMDTDPLWRSMEPFLK